MALGTRLPAVLPCGQQGGAGASSAPGRNPAGLDFRPIGVGLQSAGLPQNARDREVPAVLSGLWSYNGGAPGRPKSSPEERFWEGEE